MDSGLTMVLPAPAGRSEYRTDGLGLGAFATGLLGPRAGVAVGKVLFRVRVGRTNWTLFECVLCLGRLEEEAIAL